eukprot:TRINITY_DN5929_c0_g1_i1.p1 TRINITY_DN5929_c0_g1~~TRINITY_DN5929_c0_g1_i1.p1  ORF type:complete len:176 (-),score=49.23 TRINITY_DN5929_c0_g1_i1:44-571(-)
MCIRDRMGICTWSPKLDMNGNSVRGVSFCERFAQIFAVNNYIFENTPKLHLGLLHCTNKYRHIDNLCKAAARDDLKGFRWLLGMYGTEMATCGDYDMRTPLHLAAAEANEEMCGYLVELYEKLGAGQPTDRWGQTPLGEAKSILDKLEKKQSDGAAAYRRIVDLLEAHGISPTDF